eukprot:scaffold43597_cov33-Tisochrysis_lutea.AAC.1
MTPPETPRKKSSTCVIGGSKEEKRLCYGRRHSRPGRPHPPLSKQPIGQPNSRPPHVHTANPTPLLLPPPSRSLAFRKRCSGSPSLLIMTAAAPSAVMNHPNEVPRSASRTGCQSASCAKRPLGSLRQPPRNFAAEAAVRTQVASGGAAARRAWVWGQRAARTREERLASVSHQSE